MLLKGERNVVPDTQKTRLQHDTKGESGKGREWERESWRGGREEEMERERKGERDHSQKYSVLLQTG